MFRTAALVAWGNCWLAGNASADEVISAIRTPSWIVNLEGDNQELLSALGALQLHSVSGFRLALPVPGDPSGIAASPAAIAAAVAARAAAVAIGSNILLLPNDMGWRALPYLPSILATTRAQQLAGGQTPQEADTELTMVLASATDQLTGLDLARTRPDLTAKLEIGFEPLNRLPASLGDRNIKLARRAARILQIVQVALLDDGAALTASEAAQRHEALKPLAQCARNALCSAASANTFRVVEHR